jgi:hypothetical protein
LFPSQIELVNHRPLYRAVSIYNLRLGAAVLTDVGPRDLPTEARMATGEIASVLTKESVHTLGRGSFLCYHAPTVQEVFDEEDGCCRRISRCIHRLRRWASRPRGPPLGPGGKSAWNRHDFAAIDRLIAHDGIHDDIGNAVHAQGPGQVKEFMFLLPSLFIELKSPSRSFGRYPLKNNSRFRMAGYKRPSESFDEPTVTSVHARTRGPASVLQS